MTTLFPAKFATLFTHEGCDRPHPQQAPFKRADLPPRVEAWTYTVESGQRAGTAENAQPIGEVVFSPAGHQKRMSSATSKAQNESRNQP